MDILNESGFVVYQRDSRNAYWRRIRQKKEAQVRNLMGQIPAPNNDYYSRIGENLISLGKGERAKEIALINQALGTNFNVSDVAIEKEFIENFNQILIGADRYKKALQQITKANEEYTRGKKSLAPVLSSLFLSKLNKHLVPDLRKYINSHTEEILAGDTSDWEAISSEVLQKAAHKALEELLTTTSNLKDGEIDIFGTYATNVDLFKEYLKEENSKIFFDLIESKIGLDNIKSIVAKHLEKIQYALLKGKRKTYSSWIANNIHTSSRAGQFGGSVNEYIMQLEQAVANSLKESGRGARIMTNEMQKIDNALIISIDADVDANGILEDLSASLEGSESLIESANRMNEYYENHLKQLDKSFIIFSSGKAYGLNNFSSHGFTNDKSRGIGDLRTVLTQGPNGMSIQKAQDFIDVVINAMPGAVLQGSQSAIKDSLRAEIFRSMAYLLFDDWIAIGNIETTNAIHVFNLNGLEIPLSTLLIGAGQAIKAASQSSRWFRTDIHFPSNVKYPNGWQLDDDYPMKNVVRKRTGQLVSVPDVDQAWANQKEDAYSSVYFNTHFLSNFNSIITDFLN